VKEKTDVILLSHIIVQL